MPLDDKSNLFDFLGSDLADILGHILEDDDEQETERPQTWQGWIDKGIGGHRATFGSPSEYMGAADGLCDAIDPMLCVNREEFGPCSCPCHRVALGVAAKLSRFGLKVATIQVDVSAPGYARQGGIGYPGLIEILIILLAQFGQGVAVRYDRENKTVFITVREGKTDER